MESFQKSVLKRLETFEDKFEERLRSLEVGRTKSDIELEQVNYILDGLEMLSTGNRNNNRETEIERRERPNEIRSSQGQQVNNLKNFWENY
jgi:hypothetical protein